MKRLFLLVLVLLSISSSVFAECYLDETRWKWLFSTDECGVYYDKNTARIKSPSVFEVWACSYFPGGTSCTISACKEAGRDKTEHYHFVRAEYNSDHYTYIDKNYLINDSNGKIIFSYDVPPYMQSSASVYPGTIGEDILIKVKQDLYKYRR